MIISFNDPILITGSGGFIGGRVVEALLQRGFTNLRCLVRPSSNLQTLASTLSRHPAADVEVIRGNLQSLADCRRMVRNVALIYHLAAGRGEKSYPDAFMNSVVTTRNLLEAVVQAGTIRRFVNVSSFVVYATSTLRRGDRLDESCPLETRAHLTGEAYAYAKVKQEELVSEYAKAYRLPCTIVRPGVVYGPGNKGITGRVGLGGFGIFLHLGGANRIPLSHVRNCADAIVLAGLQAGVDGQAFNIVDDELPTSRQFLRMYKRNVARFRSIYVPHPVSYLLCLLWEKYSRWSQGQLPPTYNRQRWSVYWKGNTYSNEKIKRVLGWKPAVPFKEAAMSYFEYQRQAGRS